jgi:hypothetical protein
MFGFNNAEPIDVGEANKRLREECQGLLLQDESIDLGFKAIRDEFYFTTHRILFVDKHGITGKRTEYKSCPYHSIKAFSVETSGGFDSDSEMKVYAGSLDLSIDFDKEKVDIFEIQKYLSGHVFADSMEELLAYNTANPQQAFTGKEGGSSAKLMDYLAGDSVKLDESVVENELNAIGALVPNEKIKLAYKCGRDMVICTSKRMLYVDTQGFSGKRIEYLSMRYSCIKGYEVETAGSWDRDAEFKIFTNISQEKRCLKTDLRKGQCDVMEVLWYFNNRLLGVDSMTLEEFLPLASQSGGSANSLMSFFSDDMTQIDATLADQQFHSNPPILQANETCEIAFKGRRDLVLFTTKRILFVDKQGWSGKKMAYITFPYSSIKIFNVATAGSMDRDCEFGFFTEVWFDPPKCNGCENGCGNEEPTPGMSYIEFDINKHTTDLLGLYRYVAAKVHRHHFVGGWADLEIPRNEMIQPSPEGAVANLLNYIGQDFTELDPVEIETMLSMGGESPILIDDEKVLMAFKCGRDMTIFTSKAILSIDRKGFTGKKTEFQNIPYDTILNFATESNGSFDRDSELKLTFATPWLPNLTQDFRSGKADIVAIQNLIAAKCLGAPGQPSDFANDDTIKPSDPGSMEKLIAFISDKHLKDDPKAIEQRFKTEVPVLQADETVELAYKHGRDMFIITTKRIMLIDVQGLSGKKIEFKSIPYKFIKGFSVESAGTLSRTVKATLYCSKMVGGLGTDFGKKDTNIFEINNSVANKILNHTTHQT